MTRERWLPIPGYEHYMISNHGRVRNDRNMILRGGYDNRNYHIINLSINGIKTIHKVHRLVMIAFIGPCPDNHEVHHIDSNPKNNCLSNLVYVTHKTNMQESMQGIKNHQAVMTPDDVRQLRYLYRTTSKSIRTLSEEFDIGYSTARNIIKGVTWSHVKG